MGSPVGSPPNVNLAQNLAENDVVQEYLRMRQSNYESTLSEVVSNSPKHQQQYGMASPSSQPDPAAVEAEEEAKRKELAEAQRLQQEQDPRASTSARSASTDGTSGAYIGPFLRKLTSFFAKAYT